MSLVDKIKVWIYKIWGVARKAITDAHLQKYRMRLFQAYILIVLVIFSSLALFASLSDYFSFDLALTRELQREVPFWMGWMLIGISWFGYAVQSVITISVAVIILSILGLRWEAVTAIFAGVSAGGLNLLVKAAIRRPRPSEDLVDVIEVLASYSFPSGHVMFYTTFFGFLLFLAFILLNNSIQRGLLVLLLAIPVVSVGLSRVYLGEHWVSDVVGGYMLGSLTLILTIQFYRWGKKRWSPDLPVAPSEDEE